MKNKNTVISKPRFWMKHNKLQIMTLKNRDPDILDHLFQIMCYCFCNTELRTATVTKIKGLSIQTQQNTFVLFTLFKLTLDERKTLTKISTRKPLTTVPQTSARFGHDEIRKPTNSSLRK